MQQLHYLDMTNKDLMEKVVRWEAEKKALKINDDQERKEVDEAEHDELLNFALNSLPFGIEKAKAPRNQILVAQQFGINDVLQELCETSRGIFAKDDLRHLILDSDWQIIFEGRFHDVWQSLCYFFCYTCVGIYLTYEYLVLPIPFCFQSSTKRTQRKEGQKMLQWTKEGLLGLSSQSFGSRCRILVLCMMITRSACFKVQKLDLSQCLTRSWRLWLERQHYVMMETGQNERWKPKYSKKSMVIIVQWG